jgi:hypothetical protein
VRARNAKGVGKFSPVNSEGALMAEKPKQLVISSLKRTSGSTATLEWTIVKASMPLDSYTLYKEAENKKYYKLIGWSTKEPKYEI